MYVSLYALELGTVSILKIIARKLRRNSTKYHKLLQCWAMLQ